MLLYGKQKHEVEKFIINTTANYCILRLSRVYGLNIHDNTLITSWLKAVKLNIIKKFICASDLFFSPVLIDDLINVLKITIEKN